MKLEKLKSKNKYLTKFWLLISLFGSIILAMFLFTIMLSNLDGNAVFWFELLKVAIGIIMISYKMNLYYTTYYDVYSNETNYLTEKEIKNLECMNKSKNFEDLILGYNMVIIVLCYVCVMVVVQIFYNLIAFNPLLDEIYFYIIYLVICTFYMIVLITKIEKKKKLLLNE